MSKINQNNPLIVIILVLFLGFLMLEFFFAALFGAPNILQKYSSLAEAIISLIALLIVAAFSYGLYKLFQENLANVKPLLQTIKAYTCKKCGVSITSKWSYCAFCGSDVKNAGSKD